MELKADFVFKPLPDVANVVHLPIPIFLHPLGPLQDLGGTWEGTGFNTIWRPFHGSQDRFLELNLTAETLQFEAIQGEIPNRGLLQGDINMFGLTYLQQIKDSNLNAGLHIEPGIWAVVPKTTNPAEPPTVVRMGSIPHGTTILAQGTATSIAGPPTIPHITINPFPIGHPTNSSVFAEQHLNVPSQFRSSGAQMNGITQGMVDNPNSVLQAAIAGQTIIQTTVLQVTTTSQPVPGGGTANTAFLKTNAVAQDVSSIFWIEHVKGAAGQPDFLQLQYSQTVNLNFNTLSWPHVTVGTLRKKIPIRIPPQLIDPKITAEALKPARLNPGDPIERQQITQFNPGS